MNTRGLFLMSLASLVLITDSTTDGVRADSCDLIICSRIENEPILSHIEAKDALERMMEESKSAVIRGFVELTKAARVQVVGDQTVRIGLWECDLQAKAFSATFATPVQGRFVRAKTGGWLALAVGDGDLPLRMRRMVNRMR